MLTAVPFALFGAIVAIYLRGLENDVYFQIGLITLIGLAAKNAILIVEFAARAPSRRPVAVRRAMEAARLRFRPIIMTSLCFILGVLPLAISTGAGSAARHSIGTGVIGGMVAATVARHHLRAAVLPACDADGGTRGEAGDRQGAAPVGDAGGVNLYYAAVARMERSEIRDSFADSAPDCASLHPGYDPAFFLVFL